MKVERKFVDLRNDCFSATEKKVGVNTEVRISSHHSKVWIDARSGSTEVHAEITLTQLAWLLRNADKLEASK